MSPKCDVTEETASLSRPVGDMSWPQYWCVGAVGVLWRSIDYGRHGWTGTHTNTSHGLQVQMYLAYYLGFVGVPRLTGSKVVQQAIRANSEIRRGLEDLRIAKRLAKSARLNGMSKTDERGTHVQEYLTALVVTPRSLRIIDLVAGETISKFFVKQVCDVGEGLCQIYT